MKTGAVNQMFRAFSDPTRLRILHLLQQGTLCVGDLVAVLRVPQPTASRHLRRLRDAGLVTALRDGKWSYYSLAPATTDFQRTLLGCVGGCLGEVPELRADARRLAGLHKAGGCCAPAHKSNSQE